MPKKVGFQRQAQQGKRPAEKKLMYMDKQGNNLYGFSQENLEKTNRELRQTNKYMLALIVIMLVFLAIIISSIVWVDLNNIITALIYYP